MERLTYEIMDGGMVTDKENVKEFEIEDWVTVYAGNAVFRLAEYEDTGLTPPEIMELKERDKPKLVVYEHEFEDNRLISYVQRCESCGEQYDPSEKFNFCPNCGQRILRRKED